MSNEAAQVRWEYSETRNEIVEVGRLYGDDGFLVLETDPHDWIMNANRDDRLCVLSLELVGYGGKNIDIDCVSMLNNLQSLLLGDCDELEELPENLGDLGSLTCLSIVGCRKIKWLPNSIGKLSNLTALKIYWCPSLQELPATLGDLGSLTCLSIEWCNRIKWLPNSIGKLSNLTTLKINGCRSLEELPATLGDLGSLTCLSIRWCERIKWLPNSIGKLSNLTALKIVSFESPKELPANLGELSNLSVLDIQKANIKRLPWSIANLSKLSRLHLPTDFRLTTLPSHLNDSLIIYVEDAHNSNIRKTWGELKTEIAQFGTYVRYMYSNTTKQEVQVWRLHSDDGFLLSDIDPDEWIMSNPADCNSVLTLELTLPSLLNVSTFDEIECVLKLHNLQQLLLYKCYSLRVLPKNLGELASLNHLSLKYCDRIKWLPDSIGKLSNLTVLHLYHCKSLEELPATLGELTKLSLLNIEFTKIKWLPWSIAKLSKLSVLLLPFHFRLQTLPSHLNDSLVISAPDINIRKTWEELKTEIQLLSIPVFGVAPHFPSTPAYLPYEGDPKPWLQNKNLCSLVRILDLDLRWYECEGGISESNEDLPMLTHLYIFAGCLFHQPVTLTKITHLSLYQCHPRPKCEIQACFDSLAKLSTLQSLELLCCVELPAHMNLPVSLTHLTLNTDEYDSLPHSFVSSINKLPNLKSLALIDYQYVDLSLLNVNLVKLKLWDCSIINSLLPKGLRHLEIMHSKDFCENTWIHHEELELWLYNLVNTETLSDFSVTCTKIQSLPTIEGLLNVQQLHLQDCFNLKKLPQNMDKLVNLRFINASGTRIKSLPDSFTNLQNLQRLILPKCFAFKSLSHNFRKKVTVIEDDTDDCYYENKGYYDSRYDSREDSRFSSGSHFSGRTDQVDNVVLGSLNHELRAENEDCVEPMDVDDYLNSNETDEHHTPTISHVDNAANEHGALDKPNATKVDLQESEREIFNQQASLDRPVNSTPNATQMHEGSDFSGRTDHIDNVISSSLNHELRAENEVDTNANGLEVSENNPHVQRTVMFPSSAANPNSSLQETTLNESNNVQAFPNRETDDMEIEQRIASANSSENPIHDRSDKRKKTHKIDIPRETLEELMSQGITTEEAAKKLGVSRPTVVRSLREKGMSWPRPKKMKQHQDTSNVVQTSIPNAVRKTVEEPSLESQCQVDGQQIEEHSNAAKECTSSNPDGQPDGSPSTFVVKATHKKDSVRFDFSLRSSIEQLKAEVGKRLELDVGKFKMKYLDEEKEWMVMADVTDLKHAWDLSKSSGSNVIRLSIVK